MAKRFGGVNTNRRRGILEMLDQTAERLRMGFHPEYLDGRTTNIRIGILEKVDQMRKDVCRLDIFHGEDRLDPLATLVGSKLFDCFRQVLERLEAFKRSGRSSVRTSSSESFNNSMSRLRRCSRDMAFPTS